MYNDKVGYGPTVGDALTGLFGPGAGAAATGILCPPTGAPPNPPPRRRAGEPGPGRRRRPPRCPPRRGGHTFAGQSRCVARDSAAIGAARDAQKKGDFAGYGAALQRLDDAITKYNNTK